MYDGAAEDSGRFWLVEGELALLAWGVGIGTTGSQTPCGAPSGGGGSADDPWVDGLDAPWWAASAFGRIWNGCVVGLSEPGPVGYPLLVALLALDEYGLYAAGRLPPETWDGLRPN